MEKRTTNEGILDESERIVGNFRNELNSLRFRGVVDTSLQYTTSVSVSAAGEALRQKGFEEKGNTD